MHLGVCICALIPRVETRTRVLLLVHQLEAVKPTNTGLVAARCLPNSAVAYRGRAPGVMTTVGGSGGRSVGGSTGGAADQALDELRAAIDRESAGRQPLFLFPHDTATSLEAWRGSPRPLLLVVPDGTWGQAARAYARVARPLQLPCVRLPVAVAGAVRLRTPSRPDRLATLEAVALALGVLEGEGAEAPLLRVFRLMSEGTLRTRGVRIAPDA
jgi:DTW domain-containing protein YfiP